MKGIGLVFWQFLLPQHFISRLIGKLARCRCVRLKNILISLFIKRYKVDMSSAKNPDYRSYQTFNDFFTRELKPELRPIIQHPKAIACPVDGVVSQASRIKQGRIFQAKGHYFNLVELLGGSEGRSLPFWNGVYSTVYLAPKDYHRVHMPYMGTLEEMIYIPGKLFSVNPTTTSAISGLFAKNERVVCIFSTEIGPMAVIMVGAMIVAGIETSWTGLVAPGNSREIQIQRYDGKQIMLNKGDELGKFMLGSTVIVLFANEGVRWAENVFPENAVLFGSNFGYF